MPNSNDYTTPLRPSNEPRKGIGQRTTELFSFSAPSTPSLTHTNQLPPPLSQRRAQTQQTQRCLCHQLPPPLLLPATSGTSTSGTSNHQRTHSSQTTAVDSNHGSRKLCRRSSVAMSVNLSILHGVPMDPDLLDRSSDDGESSSDGLAEEDDAKPSSLPNDKCASLADEVRRRQSLGVPRNKAFVRLRSLMEEDQKPLASEMEHEGQITRSIRHSHVQEWLHNSSYPIVNPCPSPAAGSSSSTVSSPRLPSMASPSSPVTRKRKAADDGYPQKRQAMSPLALRAQSPSARPIAFPVSAANKKPTTTAGAIANNSRRRARSGAAAVVGNGGGLSVFSRMNIKDNSE